MHTEHMGPSHLMVPSRFAPPSLAPSSSCFAKKNSNKKGIADYMTLEFFMRTVAGNSSMHLKVCDQSATSAPKNRNM